MPPEGNQSQQQSNQSSQGQGGQSQQGGASASGSSQQQQQQQNNQGQGGGQQQANGQQQGGAGQNGNQQQQQQQAAQRPAYVPESHWDATAGTIKDEGAFAQHIAELTTFKAAEDVRRGALPANAEAYEIKTSPAFKPPENMAFKIDEQNPLWAQARTWAQKHGLSQDAFSEGIDLFAGFRLGEQANFKGARDGEIAKLGAAGPGRVTAINTWLDGMGVPGLKDRMWTAQDVQDFERLITTVTRGHGSSFSQQHRVPANGAGKIDGYEGMTFEQRRAAQDNARRQSGR